MLVKQDIQSLSITLCRRNLPLHWRKGSNAKPITLEEGILDETASLLKSVGHRVTNIKDGPFNLRADEILWIMGNANWYPEVFRQLSAMSPSERSLVVIWHAEPLPPPKAAGLPRPRLHFREVAKILFRDARATDVYTNYYRLRSLAEKGIPDVLTVSTMGRHEFLAERGISADWVPLGYYHDLGHDMRVPRDIDAFFLGMLEIPRRRRLFKHLRRCGINLLKMGSHFDTACWGENRTQLLNRTKIFINLQRHPGELSGFRLILGMANKALVVSEPIHNPKPYIPGKHFVSASMEEMPDVIRYYLTNHKERKSIVNEGFRLVTGEVTLANSISRILELVQGHVKRQPLSPKQHKRGHWT